MNELTVKNIANYIKRGSNNDNFNSQSSEQIIMNQKSSILCNVMYSFIHENEELRSKYNMRTLEQEFNDLNLEPNEFIEMKFRQDILSPELQELLPEEVINKWIQYNLTEFKRQV